ncbi:MAG: hypothetical protein EHM85_10465 [Desulfobacteraceae bacterium]|nr:MAG: hypothetical protein EHM85_10465 [Desulfobacteraceae bacterium]
MALPFLFKNLFDRIYSINMMFYQAAPVERPETRIRFAEGCKRRRWLVVRRGGLPAGNNPVHPV